MNEDARARIAVCLDHLYGARARAVLPSLLGILDAYVGRIPAPPVVGWSERDAILITYPDQVRDPGRPPLAALADLCSRHLQGLISGIHLLPFYPSSSDDGFSVIDYRRVEAAFGTWDDIDNLARHFRLMFDVVVNHVSAHSAWFQAFLRGEAPYTGYFITPPAEADLSRVVRPRTSPLLTPFPTEAGERRVWTTFSADQADLNYHEPQLLLEIVDLLLEYARRGASLLRLDAVGYLWKESGTSCLHLPQTHELVRLFRAVLDAAAPHILLVTETNVPHAENVSYFGDGRSEAQLVYNFALPPLVLDAIVNGSASALSRWAATLATPGEGTTFLNFLASHDGVGLNPTRGLLGEDRTQALVDLSLRHGGQVSMKHGPEGAPQPYELNVNYFDALSDPQADEPPALQVNRFVAAQAVMLALNGVPAIYFHSLFGSRGWPEGSRECGYPRAINRQKLDWRTLEMELRRPGSRRASVFQSCARLLRARASTPAFHPGAPQTVLDLGDPIFGVVRRDPASGEPVVCLHNLSGHPLICPPIGSPGSARRPTRWVDMTRRSAPGTLEGPLALAPYQVAWLCPAQLARPRREPGVGDPVSDEART
jgi:glucosylglycerate phosphorylase